ncbi:DUF1851 domain-containing protein [Jannaschia sp. Os4]|uniref:GAD-like domain-containing protein n=1 Tax=Jannaschia sp. Os4 TaxID=2807617 RepID=UPI00193AC3AD|nr:GAD-like domain-containing protein [Jannaschia sp. Os4]MBM2578101.1 DUF1851 domain-containing protein [Jannaschia sp. Os4]
MEFLSRIDGRSGEAALAEMTATAGPLLDPAAVPEDRIAPRVGTVPDLLVDLWRAYGVGGLHDGGLWLARPGALDPIAAAIFGGDPDLDGTVIVAWAAMGNLLCWSPRHGPVLVVPAFGAVQAPGLTGGPRPPADADLLHHLAEIHPFFFDRTDDADEPMLERARARLRPLRYGEVYAVRPVQALGGPQGIEQVGIEPVDEYLIDVVAGVRFQLQDYENGRYNIRFVGARAGEPRPRVRP